MNTNTESTICADDNTLKRSTELVGICDELEALEFLIDDDEPGLRRVAAVSRDRPALVQIRARAQFHTSEISRTLGDVRDGTVAPDEAILDSTTALTLLVDNANVASLLVVPRDYDDHRALADLRRAMRKVASRSRDPDVRARVTRICGGEFVAMSEQGMKPPRLPSRVCQESDATPGQPGAYPISTTPSLRLWLETGIDPADLLDGARSLLAQLDVWRRVQGRISEPGLLADSIRGAELLAYARLARICLWPARDPEEVAIRQAALAVIAPRYRDPDHLRAVVEWAFEIGEARLHPG